MSTTPTPMVTHVLEAHGVCGSLTWAILFPIGAIALRLINSPKAWLIHAFIMSCSLIIFAVNIGTGLWVVMDSWHKKIGDLNRGLGIGNAHTIMGLAVFAFALLQPFLGLAHHFMQKSGAWSKRTFVGAVHVYVGRLLILMGIINGGIGLLWSAESTRAENIAYGVVCAVVWVVYILMSLGYEVKRENSSVDRAKSLAGSDRSGSGSLSSPVEGDAKFKV
ncbi:hypothetical protein DOTSEDRAFT_73924 [Dothistroma septosporum NZE10]|uniref:Cytochrome b561 domain-containing protein n=1 Tax=Dothistroma septosporum (strain NZE10 / CBS 128990) TaxID=675120 RepID=N1PK87_DOTSN|nr:hypothetical protein DOTSEDRAFT_73924 [Dothistroma septosporum NZE10]